MLFRNTLAQSVPTLSSYALSLLLAPLMLAQLGLAQFGVWAVTGALALYASLLDLGITRSLGRYVAFYDASGDRRAIQESFTLGVLTVLGLGLIAGMAAIMAATPLSAVLGVLSAGEMRIVLLSSVAIATLNLLARVLHSVPNGLRQMVPPSVAATAGTGVNFVVSVVVLLLSNQLTDYAVANAAAALINLLFAAVSLAHVWSRPYLAVPARARVAEIFGFGLKNQVSWATEVLTFQTDKVLIALLLGPRVAGAYEVASRVALAVRSVGVLTVLAIIPTATAAIIREGRHIVVDYYRRYTMRSVAIAFPLLAIAGISAPFLLTAWLGEAPENSVLILMVLSAAYFVSVMPSVAGTVAVADGRPGEVASGSAVTAGVNLVGTLALTPLFGIWGALGATFLAILAGGALFLVRFHRLYAIHAREFLHSAGRPAGLALGLCLPFAVWYVVVGASPDTRLAAMVGLAVTAGAYALVYWWLASLGHYLPERLSATGLLDRLRRGGSTAASP